MSISITCPACHRRIHADDSLMGKHANCAHCGGSVYIEPPNLSQTSGGEDETPDEYTLSPVDDRPTPDPVSNSRPNHAATAPEELRCTHCGGPLAQGQEHCQACYYHSGLKRIIDTRDAEEQTGTPPAYGFRRQLQEKLSKGQSPESVSRLFDFFFGLLILAITTWLSLPFYSGLLAVGGYVVYRIMVETSGRTYRGSSLLWLTVLFAGRTLEWKSFKGDSRISVTSREKSFDDDALAAMEDLPTLQVLDLEGTGITDQGLACLFYHPSLEFLILRRTQVTADRVWELQKTIPKTCIWY